MRLTWSAFALADRDGIFTHIEADSPLAAVAVDEHIAQAARRLVDFPKSGRAGRVPGTRELVIPEPHTLRLMPWPRMASASCVCFTGLRCGPMTLHPSSCGNAIAGTAPSWR